MNIAPDGLVVVVKRACPTCEMVGPIIQQLATKLDVMVASQDDPSFPDGLDVVDDTGFDVSLALDVTTVPTVVRIENAIVVDRTEGWSRREWARVTGIEDLGPNLPEVRPGCASRTLDPDVADSILVRQQAGKLRARRMQVAALEDEMEAFFDRGFTDGLPVVPPTEVRVLRMLEGTTLAPDEVVAVIPPDLVECTVEKVAINAVMAGCRPEYLPVVLAAVEAACTDEFNMHGLLATTYFAGPVVIGNGPITRAIEMNSGINALGQGNRANATIGRALQLVVRNVGGGRPGEVDRATLGNPGKYTYCFAEAETTSPWESLAIERGFASDASTVTLFAGDGLRGVVDQLSRTPESLARSFASVLRTVAHPKLIFVWDAVLVVSPEHARVFRDAGWSKARLRDELASLLQIPGEELARGAGGCDEGMPDFLTAAGSVLPKFREGGLLIVHAGGTAGMFSGIIGGWASGDVGSAPVTREIKP